MQRRLLPQTGGEYNSFSGPYPHTGLLVPECNRYALNIGFNLLNKSIFKYFPFPYTVSTVHVIVGLAYCVLMYIIGLKDASFGRVGNFKRRAARVAPIVALVLPR
jgi:hypothetical protein